jgi:hypothetical protein
MELVLQRKFEQDPVRAIMFEALAQWPRTMWRADLLPAVARALRDGLDASDLSHRTAAAAEALVVRLFGVDPAWGRGVAGDADQGAGPAPALQARGSAHG